MVNKYVEWLAVDGNYSKARIGSLIGGVAAIAAIIWLIVLSTKIPNLGHGNNPGSQLTLMETVYIPL